MAWPLILAVNLAGHVGCCFASASTAAPFTASAGTTRRGLAGYVGAPRLGSVRALSCWARRAPAQSYTQSRGVPARAAPHPDRPWAAAGACILRAFGSTRLFSAAGARSETSTSAAPEGGGGSGTVEEVDLAGLKKETARQILRAFKKAGKAEERLRKLLERDAAGPASSDANAAKKSQETSQADGDGAVEELVALETERDALQERLRKLNDLEARLQVCVYVCVCV